MALFFGVAQSRLKKDTPPENLAAPHLGFSSTQGPALESCKAWELRLGASERFETGWALNRDSLAEWMAHKK